jgi:plasmid stabilization system protein ParE
VEKDEVANKVLIEAKVLDGSNESVKFSVDLDTVFSVKDFYDASSDTLFSDRDSAYDNTVCFGQVAYGQPQYVYDPTTRSYQLVYPQAPKKKHTGLKIAAGVLGAAALGLGAQAMYQKHKTGSFKGSWADKGIEGIKGLPRKFESKEKKEAREAQEKKDYDEKYKSDPVFKAEEDAKKRVKDAEDAALKKSSERATKRSGRKLDADIAHLNAHPELGTVAAARANRVDQMKAEHASKVITSIKNAGLEGKLLNKDGTINSEALEKHNTKYGAGHKKYIVAGKNNYTRDLDAKNESKKPKTKPDNQSQSQSQGTPRSNEQRRTKHDSKRAGKSPTQDTKPQQNTSNGKNGWTYSNIPRNKGETDENYGTRVRTIFPGLGNNTIGISDK